MYVCTQIKENVHRKRFNDHAYVQILINHISNLIIKSKFFVVFRDFRGINLPKKYVNVVCCIEFISDMSKI